MKAIFYTIIYLVSFCYSYSQDLSEIHFSLISDGKEISALTEENQVGFEYSVQKEIDILLANRYKPIYHISYGNYDFDQINSHIQSAFNDPQIDIVIATGSFSGTLLANYQSFSKPSISAIVIDHNLQQIPQTDSTTSGIPNFTYVETPFDVVRDLNTLAKIYDYQHLGVFVPRDLHSTLGFIPTFFKQALSGKSVDISFIKMDISGQKTAESIPEEVDAVYYLPFFNVLSDEDAKNLVDIVNQKKIVSTALLGEEMVNTGVLLGYQVTENLQSIPRRVATDVYKILRGINASELSVEVETYNQNLLINMETAEITGHYPEFDMMSGSILVNFEDPFTDRTYTLNGVIAKVIEQNLEIIIAEKDLGIAQKDYQIAVSDLLPEVTASTAFTAVDSQTSASSFGAQGRVGWTASGTLSQTIFAEPIFANIKINKLLREAQKFSVREAQLDAVLNASQAYLNILQAKANLNVQRQNVLLTQENYDIANAKEKVGYTGASDLNRWIAELANANINLNNAQAQRRQTEFQLNQLLNQPINEPFRTDSAYLEDPILLITDPRIEELVNNYGDLKIFADFMVEEAFRQLPELRQLELNIAATDRQKRSQQRAFFLPTFGISGNTTYNVDQFRTFPVPNEVASFGLARDLSIPTWNISVGIQYPILQGGRRRLNLQRTNIALSQLDDTRKNLQNQLELRVRSSLESVGASYSAVTLSEKAAVASRENFRIVQDAYSQGQVNITSLIDAQNAALQAELGRVNSIYQFIADFLALERSVGFFYFLGTPAEREAYFDRLISKRE